MRQDGETRTLALECRHRWIVQVALCCKLKFQKSQREQTAQAVKIMPLTLESLSTMDTVSSPKIPSLNVDIKSRDASR